MKLLVRGVIFSLICVVIFSYIYRMLGNEHFKTNSLNDIEYIDYLFLATSIQSGVGNFNIYPISNSSKIAIIIQEFTMLTTYIFLLYIFTL